MPGFQCQLIDGRYRVHGGGEALAGAIERVRRECSQAVDAGARILILSDRDCDADHAPIPSLLLTSAVHQHLIRTGQRTQGRARRRDRRGARGAPRRAADRLRRRRGQPVSRLRDDRRPGRRWRDHGRRLGDKAVANYVKALSKGVLKVMSKMGISTIASYTGAQVFEAFGLGQRRRRRVLRRHPVAARRRRARGHRGGGRRAPRDRVPDRRRRPARIAASTSAASTSGVARANCTCSTRRRCSCCSTRRASGATSVFAEYTSKVEELNRAGGTLRGLFDFRSERDAGADRRGRAGRPRSSRASRPVRCRTARSRPRRTRRWPSR